ncbi:unnamed protein product, partial [Polarella glacialis]
DLSHDLRPGRTLLSVAESLPPLLMASRQSLQLPTGRAWAGSQPRFQAMQPPSNVYLPPWISQRQWEGVQGKARHAVATSEEPAWKTLRRAEGRNLIPFGELGG